MLAHVVEMNSFQSKDKSKEFYTLVLSQPQKDSGDWRLVMDPKKGFKEPMRYFVGKDLFLKVQPNHTYEMKFGADPETGWTALVSAVEVKD